MNCRAVVLAAAAALAPSAAAAQPAAADRFLRVKEWTGTFTIEFARSDKHVLNASEWSAGSTRWALRGTLRLAREKADVAIPHWVGTGNVTLRVHHQEQTEITHSKDSVSKYTTTESATAFNGLSGEHGCPYLTLREKTYVLHLGPYLRWPTVIQGESQLKDGGGRVVRREPIRERSEAQVSADFRGQLPAHGLRLTGRTTMPVNISNGDLRLFLRTSWPFTSHGKPPPATVTWDLAPAAEGVELVLEPEDAEAYRQWVPCGSADGDEAKPGNHLAFVAKLVGRDGKPAPAAAEKMLFELADVSREPGVAINFPPLGKGDAGPDLRFHSRKNPDLQVEAAGQKAETRRRAKGVVAAKAVVSAHDYGAHGALLALAELPDGTQVIGHLPRDPGRTELPVPKRRAGSRVADYFLIDKLGNANLPDDDDSEAVPVGDKRFPGDGLTVYEEYRGFFVNGVHRRGNPGRKELFVWDRMPKGYLEPGLRLFTGVTGLVIHQSARDTEFRHEQTVNFNFSPDTPRRTNQHAVKFVMGGKKKSKDKRGWEVPSFAGTWTVEAIPGSSKNIVVVTHSVAFEPGTDAFDRATAHELGHALTIPHHGDTDLGTVLWKASGKDKAGDTLMREFVLGDDGAPKGDDKGRLVVVRNEDDTPFVPDKRFAGADGMVLWVARQNGQHSGNSRCFMRYFVAGAYVPADTERIRVWVPSKEELGPTLCMSPRATDFVERRYGDAAKDRGNCLHRFRVSDAPD